MNGLDPQLIISTVLLLVITLLCLILLFFSLRERTDVRYRPLIFILGYLSFWYPSMILLQFWRQGFFPRIDSSMLRTVSYSLGIARPGLILVFAAVAHCYLIAARERGAQLPVWISPLRVYLCSLLAIVFVRWGLSDRLDSRALSAVAAIAALTVSMGTTLLCYRALRSNSEGVKLSNRYFWPVCFAFSVLLIATAFYHSLIIDVAIQGSYDVYALTSILPLLLWLLYYHTPYLFIDVLVKWGLQLGVFALLIGSYWGLLLVKIDLLAAQPFLVRFAFALGTAFPAALLFRLHEPLGRLIDTHILGRASFPELLFATAGRLGSAVNREEAVSIVQETLKHGLSASYASYVLELSAERSNAGEVCMQVEAGGQIFGLLLVGPASTQRRYLSEDLKFIRALADALALALARIALIEEHNRQQLREAELQRTAAELQLKALQAQLDPHFLFNSMNLIGSLIRSAPDKARQAVQHLSKIYRYVIDGLRRKTVTAAEEIAFLRAYLEIEQLRFESRLEVEFDLCEGLEQVYLPPMLLQPLVENAIKHGISPKLEGGKVSIRVARDPVGYYFEISDTGVGFSLPEHKREDCTGVGLENLRQQLKIRYNTELKVESRPGNGTRVSLLLPAANLDRGAVCVSS